VRALSLPRIANQKLNENNMKRNGWLAAALVALSMTLSPNTASAQVEKGALMAGGGFGLSFGTKQVEQPVSSNTTLVTEYNYNTLTFNPKVAYFFTSALALGVDVELTSTSQTNKKDEVKSTSSDFSIGPLVRYYFPQSFFLEGKVGFGSGKGNVYNNYGIFSYSAGAGYAAFLNKHIALEPMVRYVGKNYTRSDNENFKTKYGTLQILVGLQIYF
jgi:hypothetical protein